MAVIGIEYCEGNKPDNLGYKHVYLHTSDKEIIFDSGDFVKDWYKAIKQFLQNAEHEYHLAHSSSVDNFIMDGAPYNSIWVIFNEGGVPVIKDEYPESEQKVRIFVNKGEVPTWEEYKKYCNS